MRKTHTILAGIISGLVINLSLAQAAPASLSAQLAAVEGTEPTPASAVPASGQFYPASLANRGIFAPIYPPGMGLPAWNLGDGVWLVNDLEPVTPLRNGTRMMALDGGPMPPGGGEGVGETNLYSFNGFVLDTNLLWLSVSNVTDGMVSLQLHRATNQIYGIYSAVSLTVPLADWTPVAELWPTNALAFLVPATGDMRLYRAMDWTGYTVNGLPAWWTFFWFGNLSKTATDLDGQNNTLGYDYTNGFDPNVISFVLNYTNQHVSAYGATVQAGIQSGTPSYYTVLVDSTNFSAANWLPYSSSNLAVNLGASEGWHQVGVGLRGAAANAHQTWQAIRLKLDLTPPLLTITNPIAGLIARPVIQLQGYSPESLASLYYDLTNANGLATHQPAIVLGQAYDTNTLEFTTNYFQCFDVPLTNGLNVITLHAADLAGNVTTTNFSYTLDYSSATNPPDVQLIWPKAGTKISGDHFTWRGKVSDSTASVAAQIVDTNGVTNSISGQVGRDGDFRVRDIPLGGGTNNLFLTITDVAGNVSVTQIPVVKSSLILTITSAGLGQAVTGTISDTNYTIWVNGVKATNNLDGTWIAPNPHLSLDTPAVQVRAIPNSDNGGNGGGQ
jgi:hypothetical protein